jgi:hypothetical protein
MTFSSVVAIPQARGTNLPILVRHPNDCLIVPQEILLSWRFRVYTVRSLVGTGRWLSSWFSFMPTPSVKQMHDEQPDDETDEMRDGVHLPRSGGT